jgi:predicted metal-dependent peptidase
MDNKDTKLKPFDQAVEDSEFDTRLLRFLERTPFFAELSRHIRKVPSRTLPTAGVAYSKTTDDLVMYWNPEFVTGLDPAEFNGLMTHELYHIIFQHITLRRKTPHRMWNIAADLAINSLIVEEQKRTGAGSLALPPGGLVPGQWPRMAEGREMTEEEKKGAKLAALIASLPLMEDSEFYYGKLSQFADEQRKNCPKHGDGAGGPKQDPGEGGGQENEGGNEPGEGEGGGAGPQCTCGEDWSDGFDDHDGWDSLSDDERSYVEARVKDAMSKAVKAANQRADGWGNIPADMRERIIASVSGKVDWRNVLRNFVGSVCRAHRSSSIKRINRRYPYVHPGTKKAYMPKVMVAIDMSGSVGDEALALFFGELNHLTRLVDITVAPFDTEVNEKDVFEWKKGQKVEAQRTKCGGTDFDGPTRFANDPKNRGRWDGLLILTDGQAPQPTPSRIKRAWILAPGQKLAFDSSETQIFLEEIGKK